jgi:aminopeptidase
MYIPSHTTLEKYADVLINFALNSGKGMKQGDVVYLVTPTASLPLAKAMYAAILAGGGYPLLNIIDDEFKLLHIENGSEKQITFFPKKYYRGIADTIDHWVRILADDNPMLLKDSDPRKVILMNKSARPFREWLDQKEDKGMFTWTLCLYGTKGMAKEAGMGARDYWDQIKKACFLDDPDPIERWRTVFGKTKAVLKKINSLPISRLHVEAKETDLWITLGEKRRWLGGSGRNIPSFEIFTSPDWRGTEGTIFFDMPLYRYGNIIKDIRLEFKNGIIVKASAGKNEKLLKELIKQKNADRIGEFSLTDTDFSKITKFMADTLFDENFGGRFGNTHLAVGKSYHDTYAGNIGTMTDKAFEKLGFNHSIEHTDIIATSDRTVTAVMNDGAEKVIYRKGHFTL